MLWSRARGNAALIYQGCLPSIQLPFCGNVEIVEPELRIRFGMWSDNDWNFCAAFREFQRATAVLADQEGKVFYEEE